MKGHTFDHGKGDKCKKCGKIHIPSNKGRKFSKEWCNKISISKKGIKRSREACKKTSQTLKLRYKTGEIIPWNKGLTKETSESVRKISQSNMGHPPGNKGKHPSKETRQKISCGRKKFFREHPEAKMTGNKNPAKRPEVRAKISLAHTGKKLSEEHKQKIGDTQRGIPLSEETKQNMSIAQRKRYQKESERDKHRGFNNGFFLNTHTLESRKKMSVSIKRVFRENPEKHPNRRLARKGFISSEQKKLFELVKEFYSEAELEIPIRTSEGTRFADVGVKSKKLDFEMDGQHWHNKENDKKRDKEIEEVGWKVIHFSDTENENIWRKRVQNTQGELQQL